ncbi:MAG: hypothetical protein J5I53_02215 [Bradyrhizobiaceae bacterium]|nr:hypothetical protein [Bradyrhizobiaceae bacterium]
MLYPNDSGRGLTYNLNNMPVSAFNILTQRCHSTLPLNVATQHRHSTSPRNVATQHLHETANANKHHRAVVSLPMFTSRANASRRASYIAPFP